MLPLCSLGGWSGGIIANLFHYRRWTFYVLIIWTAVLLTLVIFVVPETYAKVLLAQKAQQKRKQTGDDRWIAPTEKVKRTVAGAILRSCKVPIQLLILEPMCLLLNLYAAILLGIVYLFFGAFQLVFETNHGFQLYQVGLSFLGLGFGIIVGVVTDPFWHKNYLKLVQRLEETTGDPNVKPEPEFRLPPAMYGGFLCPIGLFWFGWTTYSSVHWIVPIIGSAVFSTGFVLAYSAILTFLVDAYPIYAASAVAANVLVRLLFAGSFPLFGNQSKRLQVSVPFSTNKSLTVYETLGYQWASSLLGFLAMVCVPMPYVPCPVIPSVALLVRLAYQVNNRFFFYRYGKQIRARSKFNSRVG